jgi:hypothetical protein
VLQKLFLAVDQALGIRDSRWSRLENWLLQKSRLSSLMVLLVKSCHVLLVIFLLWRPILDLLEPSVKVHLVLFQVPSVIDNLLAGKLLNMNHFGLGQESTIGV